MNIARFSAFAALLTAFTGLCIHSAAADSTAKAANLAVVRNFYAAGDDPQRAASFFASDAVVRMDETKPPITGSAAILAALKALTAHGEKLTARITSNFVAGPVVAVRHVDTLTVPGEQTQTYKLAAVFIVRDGKIKEWSEYSDQ